MEVFLINLKAITDLSFFFFFANCHTGTRTLIKNQQLAKEK